MSAGTITDPKSGALKSTALDQLRFDLTRRRTLKDALLTWLAFALAFVAMLPLVSVLLMLIVRGAPVLSVELFTELPPAAGMPGGGIGNAIVGTLVVVGIAAAVSIPLGLLAAIYLAEFGGTSRLATIVRFSGKILTGLPSILAGVFAYAVVVTTLGSFSALAGGIATGVLMVPVVMLTAEEALKMVPSRMKMAAFGMGSNHTQVVWSIVVPTALPGILTGVMLALARAMGETAPLLFTALFSNYWFEGNLDEPIASLAVLIYNYSGNPFEELVKLAWAASLVLVVMVLVANLCAQWLMKRPVEH